MLEPKERKRLGDPGRPARARARLAFAGLAKTGIRAGCIAWFFHCHPSTVWRWQQRVLCEGAVFFDAPRTGRPLVYGEARRLRAIAFYCQKKPEPPEGAQAEGGGHSHRWSFRWAHRWLESHPEEGAGAMSRGTLHRILSTHKLQPHRNRYFLHITDPDFFNKMEHLIELYLNPPEYLFNFDECPGIQVTLPVAPDLEARPGQPGLREFEYERRGTVDVLAFLRPKTGQVFARCTDNHTTETFLEVFTAHVESQPPGASLHYIMDNLNTHFSDAFCQRVAELSGVSHTPLKTGELRRQWLQSPGKRLVIHFTPFHGSWLNQVEVWFSILSQRCLKHCNIDAEKKKAAIANFVGLWNEHFAHPFTWKYTGEGLKEKVVSRFSAFVLSEGDQLQARFLAKQFHLMANLLESDPQIRHSAQWQALEEHLDNRAGFLEGVIAEAPKESQKLRARKAWNRLNEVRELKV